MERLHSLVLITMTTMFLFLILCSSVTARPHIAPRLTLADLDEDGAIPKNDAAENDEEGYPLPPPAVQFEAVDLPSHFETYDRNHDRRVSLKELSIVSGTKETDARMPFDAADIDHDGKLSFEEFRDAPWNFGETHQFDSIEQLIFHLADEEA